jgi:hypothetical protein
MYWKRELFTVTAMRTSKPKVLFDFPNPRKHRTVKSSEKWCSSVGTKEGEVIPVLN